jgi:putative Ca2+/H+ antiporter (TMEM165/GDT1 family)
MGDKTQLATIALGARFDQIIWVTAGTTLGMMLANVPAVFLGHELIERVPLNIVRVIAAALFIVIGVWLAAYRQLAGSDQTAIDRIFHEIKSRNVELRSVAKSE